MASVVDFSPLRINPFEGALDPLVAASNRWAQQSHEKELQDARLAQQQRNEDRLYQQSQDRIAREERAQADTNRRAAGGMTLANTKARMAADAQIRTLVDKGRLGAARELASAYAEMDPTTGDVSTGRPFETRARDVGPAPASPERPPIMDEHGPTPESGVVLPDEFSTHRVGEASPPHDVIDAVSGGQADLHAPEIQAFTASQQTAGQGYDRAVSEYVRKMQEYEASKQDAQAHPDVFIGGQPYDPEESRRADAAERAERADITRQGFAAAGDDNANFAAAIAGLPPELIKTVGPVVAARMEKEQARAFRAQQDQAYKPDVGTAQAARERLANINGSYRVKAAGVSNSSREDATNRGNVVAIDNHIDKLYKESAMPKLLQGRDALDNAIGALESNTGSGDAEAIVAIARSFRQGVPTTFEEKNIRSHMSGLMDRIEGVAQGAINGRLSDGQRADITKLATSAKDELDKHVAGRERAFAEHVAGNSLFKNYPEQVNESIKARLQPFHPDGNLPDYVTVPEDGATPALGSGIGLNRSTKKSSKQPAGNPGGESPKDRKRRLLMMLRGGQ